MLACKTIVVWWAPIRNIEFVCTLLQHRWIWLLSSPWELLISLFSAEILVQQHYQPFGNGRRAGDTSRGGEASAQCARARHMRSRCSAPSHEVGGARSSYMYQTQQKGVFRREKGLPKCPRSSAYPVILQERRQSSMLATLPSKWKAFNWRKRRKGWSYTSPIENTTLEKSALTLQVSFNCGHFVLNNKYK